MTDVIEVFADVRCPFAHLGLRRLAEERDRRGANLRLWVRAWPLELVNDAPLDPELIAVEARALREQVAPDLFTAFDPQRWPSTSMPALALTASAYAVGMDLGERVALALRWALFEEGRNIASPDVLLDVGQSAGMELPTCGEVDRVREDWHEGRARGVVGSPHFFVGEDSWFCPALDIHHENGRLWITDRGAKLAELLERALPASVKP
jgi:predicted DsbA family dithiol-disulfide isomerase